MELPSRMTRSSTSGRFEDKPYINVCQMLVPHYPSSGTQILKLTRKSLTIESGCQGQWEWEMAKVTGKGLRAILSSPW